MRLKASEFNLAAERFYRSTLRKQHMNEAFDVFEDDMRIMNTSLNGTDSYYKSALKSIMGNQNALFFLKQVRKDCFREWVSTENLKKLIYLLLLTINFDKDNSEVMKVNETPVY